MGGDNGGSGGDSPGMTPAIRAIQAELAAGKWRNQAEAEAFLQRRMAEYNAMPQAELGGLSPLQAHELLSGDWQSSGPLRFNEALPLDDFRDCHFLLAGRALLAAAAEPKGIRATTAGNLNRKTVAALLEAAPWPAGFVAETHRWNKVVNEEDFSPVHVLRLVLEIGRLLRRRRGAFHTTRRGRELLAEAQAGALAATLFRVLYQEFNLGYLGGWEEFEARQPMVPLYLLRLTVLDRDWRAGHEIVPLIDPAADPDRELARLRARYPGLVSDPEDLESQEELQSFAFSSFVHRILGPLQWFGLLEGRDVPGPYPLLPSREVRRTALLDAFVTFPASFTTAASRWQRLSG
jgi:hypothetical protein